MTFFRRGMALFNEFLVTTLNGTNLPQSDGICSISENLEFDVLCALDVLLNEHTVVTKGILHEIDRVSMRFQTHFPFDDLHTDSATTSSRFDDDRITDIIGSAVQRRPQEIGSEEPFASASLRLPWQLKLHFIAKKCDNICTGPMKVMPSSSSLFTKPAFSARKP